MPHKKQRFWRCHQCDWAIPALVLMMDEDTIKSIKFGYYKCDNWSTLVGGNDKICNKVNFTRKGKKLKKVDNKWVLMPVGPSGF